jgi:hypothetical protein
MVRQPRLLSGYPQPASRGERGRKAESKGDFSYNQQRAARRWTLGTIRCDHEGPEEALSVRSSNPALTESLYEDICAYVTFVEEAIGNEVKESAPWLFDDHGFKLAAVNHAHFTASLLHAREILLMRGHHPLHQDQRPGRCFDT